MAELHPASGESTHQNGIASVEHPGSGHAEPTVLGLNAAWYTFLPDLVLKTAAWSFFQEFKDKDMRAWDEYAAAHSGTPFTGGGNLPWDATGMTELSKFEASYARKPKRR